MELDRATVHLQSVSRMSATDATQMLACFDRFGFARLAVAPTSESPDFRRELLSLTRYFGQPIRHEYSEADGVVPVAPQEGHPEYVNTTRTELLPHTDGSFAAHPPRVVAMQCEVPAPSGGFTSLIDGADIYRALQQRDREGLAALFRPDAITVRRSNRAATKPIFQRHGDRVRVVFRADGAARVEVCPPGVGAFAFIKQYVGEASHQLRFKMQPGEILVFDNSRILHGRTAFKGEGDGIRRLNRLWLDGRSPEFPLQFGFPVGSEVAPAALPEGQVSG